MIIGKPLRNPNEGLTSIDPGKPFAMCAHVVAMPKGQNGVIELGYYVCQTSEICVKSCKSA